jgi:dTDP-4-dehydrorhamnose 3,5-epimerase
VDITPLSIVGAHLITPRQFKDDRGVFLEWYREEHFVAAIGASFPLAQANLSVSDRGVVRGIHFARVPPGQPKYVTCVAGTLYDVIVDLRIGSPTFGQHEVVKLDDQLRQVVYLEAGLGHGFCAISDTATAVYLCAEPYSPTTELTVHPLDPALGIEWPVDGVPTLSQRDTTAPTLAEAADLGHLPTFPTTQ